MELIGLIKEELLKSAELTGIWEKKLREIERREYSAPQFIEELKQMVDGIVKQVLSDNENRRVSLAHPTTAKEEAPAEKKPRKKVVREGSTCPECGQGKVIKGNTAYGCSRWKEGCTFRKPFKK